MLLTLFTGKPAEPFYFPNIQKSFSLADSGSLITSTARIISAIVLLPLNTLRDSAHHTAQIGNKLIGRDIKPKNPVMEKFKSATSTAKAEMLKAAKVSKEFALRNQSVIIRAALAATAISALGYFTVPMVSTWLKGAAEEVVVNTASTAGGAVRESTKSTAEDVTSHALSVTSKAASIEPMCSVSDGYPYNPSKEVVLKKPSLNYNIFRTAVSEGSPMIPKAAASNKALATILPSTAGKTVKQAAKSVEPMCVYNPFREAVSKKPSLNYNMFRTAVSEGSPMIPKATVNSKALTTILPSTAGKTVKQAAKSVEPMCVYNPFREDVLPDKNLIVSTLSSMAALWFKMSLLSLFIIAKVKLATSCVISLKNYNLQYDEFWGKNLLYSYSSDSGESVQRVESKSMSSEKNRSNVKDQPLERSLHKVEVLPPKLTKGGREGIKLGILGPLASASSEAEEILQALGEIEDYKTQNGNANYSFEEMEQARAKEIERIKQEVGLTKSAQKTNVEATDANPLSLNSNPAVAGSSN